MRLLLAIAFCLSTLSAFASTLVSQQLSGAKWAYYGQNFYQKKEANQALTKDELFTILHNNHSSSQNSYDTISQSCAGNCYSHVNLGYDEARRIMFDELYRLSDDSGNYVVDVYCAKKFRYRNFEEVKNMGSEINTEHTWPQSKFTNNFDKTLQKADLHHLYPTDSDANSLRGNYTFGVPSNSNNTRSAPNCSISGLSNSNHPVFLPPTEHRGNVARALFYFSVRYRLPINPSEELFLRQWHQLDPVDASERERHEIISNYQRVRNPFVDHPELVYSITDF